MRPQCRQWVQDETHNLPTKSKIACLIGVAEVEETVADDLAFTAVCQNCVAQGLGAAIMEVALSQVEPDERRRTPIGSEGIALNDLVVKRRPHVVEEQIRVERYLAVPALERRHMALGAADL